MATNQQLRLFKIEPTVTALSNNSRTTKDLIKIIQTKLSDKDIVTLSNWLNIVKREKYNG